MKVIRREGKFGAFGSLKFYGGFRHDRKHFVIVTESLMPTDIFEHSTSPTTMQINQSANFACPPFAPQLIYQLAMNLYLFHERLSCLHGDVKPENILYSRPQRRFKLIDYGNATPVADLAYYFEEFQFGSLMYRAPEILVGLPFSKPVDIWSLGAVIFEACSRKPLITQFQGGPETVLSELCDLVGPMPDSFADGKFYHPDHLQLVSNFQQEDEKFWRRWRISNLLQVTGIRHAGFLDLLAGLLDPDPETRIDIRGVLEHEYLAAYLPFSPPPKVTQNTVPPLVDGIKSEIEAERSPIGKEDVPPKNIDHDIGQLVSQELKAKATATSRTTTRKRKR